MALQMALQNMEVEKLTYLKEVLALLYRKSLHFSSRLTQGSRVGIDAQGSRPGAVKGSRWKESNKVIFLACKGKTKVTAAPALVAAEPISKTKHSQQ